MKLGKYIRQLREERDLSLREFADRINKTASFICDIELGRRNPSQKVLIEIANYFSVPISEFEKHDERVPVNDMKDLVTSNPSGGAALGVALRKAKEKKLSKKDWAQLYDQVSGGISENNK